METIRQIGKRRLQDVQVRQYLSPRRPAGLMALAGLVIIGHALADETAVLSAAAGATGSTVLLLAKAHTCSVIGLCPDADKAARAQDPGADAAAECRAKPAFCAAIKAAATGKIEISVSGRTIGKTMVLV
jgi:hypothetical protein